MTSSERFYNSLNYKPVDHVFDMEFAYWNEVHALWEKQGLPPGIDDNEKKELFFGFDRRWRPPLRVWPYPEFEIEEAGEKDGYRFFYDEDRVLCRVPMTGLTTMPEHIEYPLKTRKDWENIFKPRLNIDTPGRVSENLVAEFDFALSKDFCPWLFVGSFFGKIRNWVGFKEICYMVYDDPDLIDDMIQHLADLTTELLERELPKLKGKIPVAHFWEDICFNSGPMISPEYFRTKVIPAYTQIMQTLKKYGIDTALVDCDGWIEPLVKCWMDVGVKVMFPLEIASKSDPVYLRNKFGQEIRLMGGIDKRKIAEGGDAIIKELERLAPLVEEGGYIPHCDHLCPADVTLEKYRFYIEHKRKIFGIPKKEEKIRKYPCE